MWQRFLGVVFYLAASMAAGQSTGAVDLPIAITDVTVIDGSDRPPRSHMTVLIVGGKIISVGPTPHVKVPADARTVAGTGKFLIPGLWDMHLHLGDYQRGKAVLPVLLANGITGVRDMGSPLDDILRLRDDVRKGALAGPRLIVAGPLLQGPLPFQMPLLLSVKDPSEAHQTVRMLKSRGVDFVKVQDAVPADIYAAIVDAARRDRIPLAGHIPPTVRASVVASAGQASVEHLGGQFFGVLAGCSREESRIVELATNLYRAALTAAEKGQEPERTNLKAAYSRMLLDTFDQDKATKLFHLFARKGIWHCPTVISLKLWESNKDSLDKTDLEEGQAVYDKQLDLIRQMRRSGVRFLAGTDLSPGEPVANLHEELRLLTKVGFTPLDAIRTATRNPAIFLDRKREFGSVAVGKVADLVLLEADPSVDISSTRRIAAVLVNGRFFDKTELDRMRNQGR